MSTAEELSAAPLIVAENMRNMDGMTPAEADSKPTPAGENANFFAHTPFAPSSEGDVLEENHASKHHEDEDKYVTGGSEDEPSVGLKRKLAFDEVRAICLIA